MRQRLTVHLSGVKAEMEERKNKRGGTAKVPVIQNTVAFVVHSHAEVHSHLEQLRSIGKGVEVKKHYLSGINN